MESVALAVLFALWMGVALALSTVMARQGYDAPTWAFLGVVLGPIAVAAAAVVIVRATPAQPTLVGGGVPRQGSVDVLVGADGSAESRAAITAVQELLGDRVGRLTLALVVPLDIKPELEREAERDLAAEADAAEGDTTAVLLKGQPAKALQRYATEVGYELIAAGTRGAGRAHPMLGSVASVLAKGCAVPVLLVDAPASTERASRASLASARG